MHYEVERREGEDTNSEWRPIKLFHDAASTLSLRFVTLGSAKFYVRRYQPGAVRIVRVTDDGEREVVEAGCL
jgi:hypothetical protein